ncbi:hypothetical protein [Nonomuraea sp. NEAU-A123]|uniref:hypothetical protein n=1 Tax=Nonomuraea sp. NEAU-A123 TaxID=2839649 RepID=UPI001BE3D932|nr:hypothetical protein [Nonomuraea sp. NEAU-A123]MBT2226251.1 hypothetical protein [Nonomuraea sp. NEAU-A123]
MENQYPATPTEHYRAGVEALDEAYAAVNTRGTPEEGPDPEETELVALVRSSIARAHFAAATAISTGLASGDADNRRAWADLARETRTPEIERAVEAAL